MRAAFLIVSLPALLFAAAALAQAIPPGEEGELARFVPPQPGAHVCFARAYDAAHLAAHPDQSVTAMEFRIAYYRWDPDETYPDGQRNYYFQLLAKRRGGPHRLTAVGECISLEGGSAIGCGVDCDGGGVTVKRLDGGSVLVDLGVDGRIRLTEGCSEDEEDGVDLVPGRDDRSFRLDPVPASQCPAYEQW